MQHFGTLISSKKYKISTPTKAEQVWLQLWPFFGKYRKTLTQNEGLLGTRFALENLFCTRNLSKKLIFSAKFEKVLRPLAVNLVVLATDGVK